MMSERHRSDTKNQSEIIGLFRRNTKYVGERNLKRLWQKQYAIAGDLHMLSGKLIQINL